MNITIEVPLESLRSVFQFFIACSTAHPTSGFLGTFFITCEKVQRCHLG